MKPGDTSRQLWGAAVDIGTTTVVGYLFDLTSGRIAAVEAALNGQQIHGADVITRIDYALHEPQGLERLRELVLATINGILERLCTRQGLSSQAIYQPGDRGQPHHEPALLGHPPLLLVRAPYNPDLHRGA